VKSAANLALYHWIYFYVNKPKTTAEKKILRTFVARFIKHQSILDYSKSTDNDNKTREKSVREACDAGLSFDSTAADTGWQQRPTKPAGLYP
jgi:hypothetical protein